MLMALGCGKGLSMIEIDVADVLRSDVDYVGQALDLLRKNGCDLERRMADFAAALCDVDATEMFKATDVVYLAHARWFYWFAYRYMTGESYDKMARQQFGSHAFSALTIKKGESLMAMMIDNDVRGKKRWNIMRAVIK